MLGSIWYYRREMAKHDNKIKNLQITLGMTDNPETKKKYMEDLNWEIEMANDYYEAICEYKEKGYSFSAHSWYGEETERMKRVLLMALWKGWVFEEGVGVVMEPPSCGGDPIPQGMSQKKAYGFINNSQYFDHITFCPKIKKITFTSF